MRNFTIFTFFLLLFGCGRKEIEVKKQPHEEPLVAAEPSETGFDSKYEELKNIVSNLQITLALFEAFTTNEFYNCSNTLDSFQQKICKIAQSSNAEQRVLFGSQLSEVVKVFQVELYGDDCFNDIEIGCPGVGSISERMAVVEAYGGDILDAETDIINLQNQFISMSVRFDQFNGTSSSIELIIDGMSSQLSDLETRVSEIETLVSDQQWLKTAEICGNIASSGPVYEAIIYDAALTKIISYQENGNSSGLGVVAEIGDGDSYLTTNLNTKNCKHKIYDTLISLKICWNLSNRKASESSIDLVCDAVNSFSNPTSDCYCLE